MSNDFAHLLGQDDEDETPAAPAKPRRTPAPVPADTPDRAAPKARTGQRRTRIEDSPAPAAPAPQASTEPPQKLTCFVRYTTYRALDGASGKNGPFGRDKKDIVDEALREWMERNGVTIPEWNN